MSSTVTASRHTRRFHNETDGYDEYDTPAMARGTRWIPGFIEKERNANWLTGGRARRVSRLKNDKYGLGWPAIRPEEFQRGVEPVLEKRGFSFPDWGFNNVREWTTPTIEFYSTNRGGGSPRRRYD